MFSCVEATSADWIKKRKYHYHNRSYEMAFDTRSETLEFKGATKMAVKMTVYTQPASHSQATAAVLPIGQRQPATIPFDNFDY